MSITSGDVREITLSKGDVSVVLFPMSNEEFTFDPGGFRNADNDDMIDGGGRAIHQKQRKRAFIEGPVAWDKDNVDELSLVRQIAELPGEADITVEHVSGKQWSGKVDVVGDIQGNLSTGQFPFKASGSELQPV